MLVALLPLCGLGPPPPVLLDLVLEGRAPLDDGHQPTLVLRNQQDRRLQRLRPRLGLKSIQMTSV